MRIISRLRDREVTNLTPRARTALGVLVLLQIAHSLEEYFGRLWESFPPARAVSSVISSDLERGFVIFNVILITFALWCWLWPVRLRWRSAVLFALLLVAIGVINGIGHPLWSIYRGGYTPGVATAPLILIVAIYVASQLLRPAAVVRRGHSSVFVVARPRRNSIKEILKGTVETKDEQYNNNLALLTPSQNASEREWLESSITTFARNVASFVPGHFEAYGRISHPIEDGQAMVGRRPKILVEPLIENLKPATTTPDHCFFAVWEGFGDSVAHHFNEPTLDLPHRRYHVFEGPVEASRTSFSDASFIYTAANLWWPADRAWFVSTEVDHAWTYVGGSRTLIDALLNDERLDAVETFASAHS